MLINDKIRDGKLQYFINREAAKISALSSGKKWQVNKKIEKANFPYYSFAKAFEKQTEK